MIVIEKPRNEADKFCMVCGKRQGDTMELKFSVGNSVHPYTSIYLCENHRGELMDKLLPTFREDKK